ncbi:MAG: DUF2721 domain-containing protein [Gammaproteobacteria bacterium]|nr:MAG: DUF2721 domain-containing protein [Gammaproteobacteria bacterium]
MAGASRVADRTLLNDRTTARTAAAISGVADLWISRAWSSRRSRRCSCSPGWRPLLVALVVVTLFANALVGSELGVAIAVLFVGAMLCLSAAFVTFFIEVRLATAALRIGPRH